MTDDTPHAGAIYTRPGHEARIVGEERHTEALAASLNDPTLHVAWRDVDAPVMITARTMRHLGYDYPVFVLPNAIRAQWEADPTAPSAPEHDGPLPEPQNPDDIARFGLIGGKP